MDQDAARWREIINDPAKSWVLFSHGTCVILMQPGPDLAGQAIELLREWGPVQIATPSADFNVIHLVDLPGWIVTCHHPDILTYVGPQEIADELQQEFRIGLAGRYKRDQAARELVVKHVEDRRIVGHG